VNEARKRRSVEALLAFRKQSSSGPESRRGSSVRYRSTQVLAQGRHVAHRKPRTRGRAPRCRRLWITPAFGSRRAR
jgi:hypothetical protein